MKRLVTLLMLLALPILYTSCSDKDDPDPEKENTIDERLIGKWKVEYSKTITPAVYVIDEADLKVKQEKYPSLDLKIGVNPYGEVSVSEYFGNYGEPDVVPRSSMFGNSDVWIDIKKSFTIDAYHTDPNEQGYKPKVFSFIKMNEGIILNGKGPSLKIPTWKYYFEKDLLVIELITPDLAMNQYIVSKYSRL